MENEKVRIYPQTSKPEVSEYTGIKSFAFEPIVEHEIYVSKQIEGSNFRAEMNPKIREKLKHLSGKGVLISGFSGTGKTSLVRYLALQDGALIISVEKDDSTGIMNAKFNEATNLLNSGRKVYVVFDEIDEFGSKESLGADVSKISTVLRKLDGIDGKNSGVYYFGTTNDLPKVDQRLMRPGRLEELVEVPLPTTEQKEKIINNQLEGTHFAGKITPYIKLISKRSRGYTPADLRGFLKDLSIYLAKSNGRFSEDLVLERLKAFQPTAKKGFEYFKTPEFDPDDLVGRELESNFFRRILENNSSANFLLYGPNGTGKTLMPEVLAELLDMNYIEMSASELKSGIVHGGEKKIDRLIHLAKLCAPCTILLDEIEGLISRRGTFSHKDDETAHLNSVLSRPIDGVYFFMTTNTPHLLNETILTRFPYKAFFDLPTEREIKSYLEKEKIEGLFPEGLKGYSFRDLANLSRVHKDYGKKVLHNFLAQHTPENRNRTEDWGKIKYHVGDSLGLERTIQSIEGKK